VLPSVPFSISLLDSFGSLCEIEKGNREGIEKGIEKGNKEGNQEGKPRRELNWGNQEKRIENRE
jgi:flagellar biosynthesis/type III secretory pathway protein FliH